MPETTRWGLLGAGQISRTQSLVLPAAEGAELFAVAARDIERARELGAPRAYGSYAELIADPDVDAVYIGLPNDAHLPWAVEALRAGKPVLCEKPLALSAAEVDEMIAVADDDRRAAGRGVLVPLAPPDPHGRADAPRRCHRRADRGQRRVQFAGVPADNFRLDPAKGGGALYDVGCYAVSGVLWSVGQGLPVEVTARTAVTDTGVDLTADLLLTWASGATAEVHVSIDGAAEAVADRPRGSAARSSWRTSRTPPPGPSRRAARLRRHAAPSASRSPRPTPTS